MGGRGWRKISSQVKEHKRCLSVKGEAEARGTDSKEGTPKHHCSNPWQAGSTTGTSNSERNYNPDDQTVSSH